MIKELKLEGITFNDDGSKMFVIGINGDDVSEYSLDNPTFSTRLCKRCHYQFHF